jgi:hypothetical protein
MQYSIRNRFTGAVQFTAEIDCDESAPGSVKAGLAALWAVKAGANLSRTSLIDGGQRADGYRFVGWVRDGNLMINSVCRDFTIDEAREHWGGSMYRDAALGAESLAILDRIEATARIRKLITEGDGNA